MTGYQVAPGVAWLETTDQTDVRVVVAPVPSGPPVALQGSSALIWLCAVEGGTGDEVVSRVAALVGTPRDVVADDVRVFLADLVARRLLLSN